MSEENGTAEETEILKQCGESVFYSPHSSLDDDVDECTSEETEVLKQCGESVFYSPDSVLDDDVDECMTAAEETEFLKQCGESIFYSPEPLSDEDRESKLKLCGDSTFRLLKSVNDISQLTDAVLNITDTESETPVFDKQKEQLLRDVLYTVDRLMGKSGEWRVTKSNCHMGFICQEAPTTTAVSLEEVIEQLEKAFSTDRQTIQRLREEAQERKPAELSLSLTLSEAEIQCQKDAKGPTNSYIRLKVGPKFYEEHETPQLKGTRFPKWKHDMKIKICEILDDYLLIELWHEEEEIRKKRHKLTGHSHETGSKHILLASLRLHIRDTLESGISGWYKLQNHAGSNLNEVTRVQLSGELSCSSDVEDNSQEAYDRLLKCLVDHHIMENSDNFDESTNDSDSWRDRVPASVTAILSQYALILNLSQANQLLSWWNIVTNMSSSTDWTLVLTQFNNIKTSLVMGSYSLEQQHYLSASLSRIIDNCMENVKHLQRCFPADNEKSKAQLTAMLQIMKSMQDHPKIRSLLKETIHSTLQDFVRAGLYGFSKHWWNKISELLSLCSKKKEDQLRIILTITKEVYNLLLNVSGFYDKIFSNEFDICCLKVAYQTIVEEMMEAIEPVIISCCEAIPVCTQMIGDDGVECDFLKGSYLMKIYKNLFRISRVRCSHSASQNANETGIEDFHKLFETAVLNQLALTTDRELNIIDEITSMDTLEPIISQDHFSSSLLEATAIAHRMKVWWLELSCPDLEDRVRYLKRILKNLMFLATTYCDKLYKKLDFMFEGNDGDSQHIINKKVCVAITNMDLMMQEIGKFPVILGYKLIENKIEEKHAKEIQAMVENTTKNVKTTLETFIVAIVDRRKTFLESIIIQSCQGEGATYFLKDVLHPTIDLLLKMLELSKIQEFLKCLWNTLLKIMRNIITDGPQRSPSFHEELLKLVKKVFSDFTPESGEALDAESAETQEYTSLVDDLQILAKDTPELITSYYQERLREQNDESVSSSASLVIRTWFQESSKLMVHIIMVRNVVVPPEEQNNAPLDYYIKIQILPEELCQIPENSTEVLKEDPATYDKEFEIDIGDNEESIRDGVLLLILRDRNRTRSDTFLGEAVVLLADVPSESKEATPMYLKMTMPVYGESCRRILQVLSCRKSDKQAAAFIKVLKKRYSVKSFLKESKDEKEKDEKEKEEKEKENDG